MSENKPSSTSKVTLLNMEPIFTADKKKEISALIEAAILSKSKTQYLKVFARGIVKADILPTQYVIYLLEKKQYTLSQQLIEIINEKTVNIINKEYKPEDYPDIEKYLDSVSSKKSENNQGAKGKGSSSNSSDKKSKSDKSKTQNEASQKVQKASDKTNKQASDQPEDNCESADAEKKLDFFLVTMMPAGSAAANALTAIETAVTNAGFTVQKAIGDQATVALAKTMLTSNLKAFINIGHGSPNGIMMSDGTVSSAWFNQLEANELTPEVVYFNSCRTYYNPLLNSVTTHGSRTYVAGLILLTIGPSDECTELYWETVLEQNRPMMMIDAVNFVNRQYMLKTGTDHYAFGLAGDGGYFIQGQ